MAGRKGIRRLARYAVASAFIAAGLLLVLASQSRVRAATGSAAVAGSQVAADGGTSCGGDADDVLKCGGPLDQLAGLLVDKGFAPPDQRDADLGGVAATGILLLSVGGAAAVGGAGGLSGALSALGGGPGGGALGSGGGALGSGGGLGSVTGGSGSASGASGGTASSAGAGVPGGVSGSVVSAGATMAGGFSLPLPRAELVSGGLSIFRSMKRVTEDADPSGYGAGDVTQLLGDATGIAALAGALAPMAGLVSLATSGVAATADVRSPQEIFSLMRRNVARLGYLRGVVDENLSHTDQQLGDLDVAADANARDPLGDPAAMSNEALRAARTEWARRMDSVFDALAATQAELDDLDARRTNLAHQVDALGDLLARADSSGSTPVSAELAGIITYGNGWYAGGDASHMAAGLRDSFAKTRIAGATRRQRAGSLDVAAGVSASPGGPPAATATTLAQLASASSVGDARLVVLGAMAGLERWRGFYDALAGSVQARLAGLRAQADQAVAARRDLAAEVQRRAMPGTGR